MTSLTPTINNSETYSRLYWHMWLVSKQRDLYELF